VEIAQAAKQCQTLPKDENSQESQAQPSVGDKGGQTTLSGSDVETLQGKALDVSNLNSEIVSL